MPSISIVQGNGVDARTRYQVTDWSGNLYLRPNLSQSFLMFKPNGSSFSFVRNVNPSDPSLQNMACDVTIQTQGAIPSLIFNAMNLNSESVIMNLYPN